MKFKEYLLLLEEEEEELNSEPPKAEDLFSEGKVVEYVSKELWDIRAGQPGEMASVGKKSVKLKKDQYLARNHYDLKDQKILQKDEFFSSYEPVRDNQKPDAEGFMLYRDGTKIEAIQYDGKSETILDNQGQDIPIHNDEYLARYKDDPDTYFVLTAGDLKTNYKRST